MRVLMLVFALAVAGLAASAADDNAAGTCPPTVKAASPGDVMVESCIATCLGVDKDTMSKLRAKGWSAQDIVMAAALAKKTGCSIDQIVSEYDSCKNWAAVAKMHNVSVSDLAKMPMMSDSEVEAFNQCFVATYYSIATADVARLRSTGFSWGEVHLIANAAAQTGQTVQRIADLRCQGMSWNQIAEKFNVPYADLTRMAQTRLITMTRMTAGAGPTPGSCPEKCYLYDRAGNIILSEDQAMSYYRRGYDWLDVAIAANVASATGYPIDSILLKIRAGYNWRSLICDLGLAPSVVLNVCDYPFPRTTAYSQRVNESRMRMIERYQVEREGPPRQTVWTFPLSRTPSTYHP